MHPHALAAVVLLAGIAQAQSSTTCAWVPKPSAAKNLHCSVYGRLNPDLVNLRQTVTTPDLHGCFDACLASDSCVSLSYNSTSSECMEYGHNLVQMGIKQQVTGDTIFYNHKCFVQNCQVVASTTSSSAGVSSTSQTSGSATATSIIITSSVTSSQAAYNTQDSCFDAFNRHPKVASSVCGDTSTQTVAPKGFKKACAGAFASRIATICPYFSTVNTKFTPMPQTATTSSDVQTTSTSLTTSSSATPSSSSSTVESTSLSTSSLTSSTSFTEPSSTESTSSSTTSSTESTSSSTTSSTESTLSSTTTSALETSSSSTSSESSTSIAQTSSAVISTVSVAPTTSSFSFDITFTTFTSDSTSFSSTTSSASASAAYVNSTTSTIDVPASTSSVIVNGTVTSGAIVDPTSTFYSNTSSFVPTSTSVANTTTTVLNSTSSSAADITSTVLITSAFFARPTVAMPNSTTIIPTSTPVFQNTTTSVLSTVSATPAVNSSTVPANTTTMAATSTTLFQNMTTTFMPTVNAAPAANTSTVVIANMTTTTSPISVNSTSTTDSNPSTTTLHSTLGASMIVTTTYSSSFSNTSSTVLAMNSTSTENNLTTTLILTTAAPNSAGVLTTDSSTSVMFPNTTISTTSTSSVAFSSTTTSSTISVTTSSASTSEVTTSAIVSSSSVSTMSTSECIGCTTSTITAATTASAISPSGLPAASITTSATSAAGTSSTDVTSTSTSEYPAGPTDVGPMFFAQVVGQDSTQNGKYLVLTSSQQGTQTQTDTGFVQDPSAASMFQLDSLGHLKVVGDQLDQEAFNFFYDTSTAVSEDYLVWDNGFDVATKDRSKPMYCFISDAGELQCMNSHEKNSVFTTFFTCEEFAYLGMGVGESAFPSGSHCTVVTINVAQPTTSSAAPSTGTTSAQRTIPTCDGATTATFYLMANSTATNAENMNNLEYLVTTPGDGFGYTQAGVTYFTDDFSYATPFTISSDGDLVLADYCNQDGYWDTYGQVLGFNIANEDPNDGYGEFRTGHPATFFIDSYGTLQADIDTEDKNYNTQEGVFFVCNTSPKLRFDWNSAYVGKHMQGCDMAQLEVIYGVGPAPATQD